MSQLDIALRLLATDLTAGAFASFGGSIGRLAADGLRAAGTLSVLKDASTGLAGSIASDANPALTNTLTNLGLLNPATASVAVSTRAAAQAFGDTGAAVKLANTELLNAQKAYAAADSAAQKAETALSSYIQQNGGWVTYSMEKSREYAALQGNVATATETRTLAESRLTSAEQEVYYASKNSADAATAAEAATLAEAGAAAELVTRLGFAAGALAGVAIVTGELASQMSEALSQAGDLQMSITQLGIASGTTAINMDTTGKAIQAIADKSLYTLNEVSQAHERLVERGQTLNDVLKYSITSAVQLGEAIHEQAVPAADLLGITMKEFGIQAKDASHTADVLTTAFYNGIPSTAQLGQGIRNLAPVARMLGSSLDDAMSVLTLLGGAMGNASMASTALRYMFMQLAAPTDKAANSLAQIGMVTINQTSPAIRQLVTEMEKSTTAGKAAANAYDGSYASLGQLYAAAKKIPGLGLTGSFTEWGMTTKALSSDLYDSQGNFLGMANAITVLKDKLDKIPSTEAKVAFLKDIFSIRGEQAAALLTNLGDVGNQLVVLQDKMKNQGTAARDAAALLDTFKGSTEALKTTVASFLGSIGMNWLPILTPIEQSMTTFLYSINQTNPGLVKLLSVILPVTVAIGVLTLVIGGATIAMALLDAASIPVMPILLGVAAGIAGLVIAGTALGFAFAWIKSKADELWKWLKPYLQPALDDVGRTIHDQLLPALGHLKDALVQAKDALGPLVGVILNDLLPGLHYVGPIILGTVIVAIFAMVVALEILVVGLVSVVDHLILWAHEAAWTAKIAKDALTGNFKQMTVDLVAAQTQYNQDSAKLAKDWADGQAAIAKTEADAVVGLAQIASGTQIKQNQAKNTQISKDDAAAAQAKIAALTAQRNVLLAQAKATDDEAEKQNLLAQAKALGDQIDANNALIGQAQHQADTQVANQTQTNQRLNRLERQQGDDAAANGKTTADQMLLWGQHAGDNFANGLTNSYSHVLAAANSIANTVSRVLAHTRPVEGPLSGGEEIWGQHLVENLIGGINSRIPALRTAVGTVASTLATPQSAQLSYQAAVNARTEIRVPLVVDSHTLAEVIINPQTMRAKLSGVQRTR